MFVVKALLWTKSKHVAHAFSLFSSYFLQNNFLQFVRLISPINAILVTSFGRFRSKFLYYFLHICHNIKNRSLILSYIFHFATSSLEDFVQIVIRILTARFPLKFSPVFVRICRHILQHLSEYLPKLLRILFGLFCPAFHHFYPFP